MNTGTLLYKKEQITGVGVTHTTEKVVAVGRCLRVMRALGCTSQQFILILVLDVILGDSPTQGLHPLPLVH